VSEGFRVALVTGASGGIGAATAELFAAEGWQVIGLARGEPDDRPTGITYRRCDLSVPAEISATMAAISEDTGRIDALVNNAALQVAKPLAETTDEEFEQVMAVNVRAPFMLIRAAVPLMPSGATIVNVASVHAVATSKGIAAYAASKGAVVALTRAAALELAEAGIRVNAVLPGAVDTPMLRAGLGRRPEEGGAEEGLRLLASRTPRGRIARPEEIAQTILFLASERSANITGQAVVDDGGATVRLSTE
jgi:NAD(P)-dependent dehydrogenase (short-subunit alcohol dehydrogenase family)